MVDNQALQFECVLRFLFNSLVSVLTVWLFVYEKERVVPIFLNIFVRLH